MSWDSWTDSCISTGNGMEACEEAWICDQAGNKWGYTHNNGSHDDSSRPKFSAAEFAKMFKVLSGTATQDEKASGIDMGGEHFFMIRSFDNDHAVYKKKSQGGITIAKAKTCVLVGRYSEGMQPGNNTAQVLKTRDQLKDSGY